VEVAVQRAIWQISLTTHLARSSTADCRRVAAQFLRTLAAHLNPVTFRITPERPGNPLELATARFTEYLSVFNLPLTLRWQHFAQLGALPFLRMPPLPMAPHAGSACLVQPLQGFFDDS